MVFTTSPTMRLDFMRQRAAIGVAEHDPAGTLLVGGARAGKRERRIGLVAVEEMLAVEQDLTALGARGAHAVPDGGDVFFGRGLERNADMIIRRFGNKTNRRPCASSSASRPGSFEAERPGRRVMPKAVNVAPERALLTEQLGIDRVGAGIAAFDIIDAELVEHAGDRELVGEREIDAVGLRAIAQGGVKQIQALAGHWILPFGLQR